jgi:hypothetical protein
VPLDQGGYVVAPSFERREQVGLLQQQLIGLAGTPDDNAQVGADLVVITQLAVERIAEVEYASVTSRYEGAYATVATSSDLAVAVDEAQYHDAAGPCLEALESGIPTPVPEIAATMAWPGFREVAGGLGLQASLSVPLFAGSGRTLAALNLYSRHSYALAPLSAAVWTAYDQDPSRLVNHGDLDPGSRELVGGLIGALALRNMIQQAIGIVMSDTAQPADGGYLTLRMRAAESGASLIDTAARIIEQQEI